ncbi:MAG: hypothetical protein ACAH95_16080 [Fimbriimonas sp.]
MSEPIDGPPPIQSAIEEEEVQTPPEPLAGIPFPPIIKLFAAVTLAAFIFALTRVPHELSLAIGRKHAKDLIEKGDPKKAVTLLEPIVNEYPNAKDVRMELTTAYVRSHDVQRAITGLMWFEGKEVSGEESAKLDAIAAELEPQLKQFEEKP